MKLHRDLIITQKLVRLAHRARQALTASQGNCSGPVDADKTYKGGMHANRLKPRYWELPWHGAVGKTVVAGVNDRGINMVRAKVVGDTRAKTLQGFVWCSAESGAMVYTNEAVAHQGMAEYGHEAVAHSTGEHVRGIAHTSGFEVFCWVLKRAHKGTFHKFSQDCYVQECAGRHKHREQHTINMMVTIGAGVTGNSLKHDDLIADIGLSGGVRS